MRIAVAAAAVTLIAKVHCQVAVVEGTITESRSPSEGPAARAFFQAVANCLSGYGLPVTKLSDEDVAAGRLKGHAIAVFPYSAVWSSEEADALLSFVRDGGKVLVFYTAPSQVYRALGADEVTLIRAAYDGQLAEMRREKHAPAIFPEKVHQNSGNMAQITKLGPDAKVLYRWFDAKGKDTGLIAATFSPSGILFTHVLAAGDWTEQQQMLLAAVLYLWPEGTGAVLDAALKRVMGHTAFETPEALISKAPRRAAGLATQFRDAVARAKAASAARNVGDCLRAAGEAQDLADRLACSLEEPRDFELRGCWASVRDGTDWDDICRRLAEANFNAIFPNMSSAGRAWYPTDILPVAGKRDELAACIRAARRYGIEVHVWRVNWCTLGAPKEWLDKLAAEGRLMQRWDGTSMFDDPSADRTPWLCPSDQRNRELERDAMLEVVRRYHPDGIHFDYMRFPSANYCYCDRCRRKFEEATGVRVDQWPADCRPEGRLWGQWVKWRADLITSLAQEIAAEAHRIDPSCKVSLAARALPGAPIYDGQDWPRWCREHILDFVVPMNYTGGDRKRLQQVISDQLGAIGQSVPLYSGLGVTYRPESLSDPVTMSSQIVLARELGAQGFVIFVWNDVLKAALPALREGVCRSRVSLLPHRSVDIPVKFDWRAPDFEPPLPARVFPFNQPPTVTVRVSVPAGRSGEGVLRVAPCAGGAAVAEQKVKLAGPTTARIALPAVAGVFEVQIAGSVGAGKLNFFRRSLPLRLLTGTQMEQLTARLKPPQFSGGGIRVGVAVGGYGSDGILSALVDSRQFLVAPLYSLSRDFLASCQVVVVPQLRSDVEAQFNAHIDELREFVRNGGGLLLTHDAVGMRAHRPVFPELATALPRPVRSRTVQVATGHTITDRLPKQFDHSYYDHIALVPESGALTLLRDEQGNAVAVAFQYGKGRVVACGMAVGLREDDTEAPPLDGELDFLVNAIHWLATTR